MSTIRTLQRNIKERQTGERGQDKSRAWSDELGAKESKKRRARRRSEIAKQSRRRNRS